MAIRLRVLLSPSRLTGLLLAITAVSIIGLLLGLPALADPAQPVPPLERGYGSGVSAAGIAPRPAPQRGSSVPAQSPKPTAAPPVAAWGEVQTGGEL